MVAAKPTTRRGYTIMELLVVIVIIIIISAIAVPVVQTMLDDGRLQGAEDMIRARTADARAYAMETGKPWRVACVPGTGTIMIAPEESTDWEQVDTSIFQKPELIRDQLPRDVYFGASAADVQGAGPTPSGGSAWQTIAVYTYDGSAREDSIIYFGKYGTPPMAMEVRGLTGSVNMRSAQQVMGMQP